MAPKAALTKSNPNQTFFVSGILNGYWRQMTCQTIQRPDLKTAKWGTMKVPTHFEWLLTPNDLSDHSKTRLKNCQMGYNKGTNSGQYSNSPSIQNLDKKLENKLWKSSESQTKLFRTLTTFKNQAIWILNMFGIQIPTASLIRKPTTVGIWTANIWIKETSE